MDLMINSKPCNPVVASITDSHVTILGPIRVMTVQDLIDALNEIADKETPVWTEDGNPVHYTCHGMSQGGNKFFIGVL